MSFKSEKIMVDKIKISDYFSQFKEGCQLLEEVDGFFGIPDLVIITPYETYSYEAKLSNWKRAIYQAFRYKAFSDKSFVILDSYKINPALNHLDQFIRSNVGLMDINDFGSIHTYYDPVPESPFSPRLDRKFKKKYRAKEA